MLTSFLDRVFRGKKVEAKSKITITSINLKFMGNSHGMNGFQTQNSIFDVSIPFQNKMGSNLLPDNLKGPKLRVSKITVAEPFRLLEVDPGLPVDVEYMSRVMFRLRLKGPEVTYEGPLSINFGNESADNVGINVQKIVLHYKDRDVQLEESGVTATMQKGQVFKQSVQLYKILSLGENIKSVEVARPFELVSSDPTLPLTADKKDSYIMGLFIKCPDSSYAGSLEITFR